MKYSIVIPVYNSEKIVGATVRTTLDVMRDAGLDCELILVNDHSSDGSWNVIREFARAEPHVVAIDLLKNYGQHHALMCGFRHATGDFVVTLDDDMQNPPAEILKLVEKANEGHDAVFGKFIVKRHGVTRSIGSKIVGYLNYTIFDRPRNITLSNFRIIRRDVINRILAYRTVFPYVPGMVLKFSASVANVLVEHRARPVGVSNYGVRQIATLLASLLFGYSSYPMRAMCAFGFVISTISFLLGLGYLCRSLFIRKAQVAGWTTTVVLLSFLLGFVILMLGMVGEYLVRILNLLSTNESYHEREVVRMDQKEQ